ncbi:hypothetical protein JQX13_05360 [Archangium violaceum]|uniref:hypothetical protein n=1 Tax=Archangium violaceum TaxID=83451 RepID=UPI00193C6224|nr:hypothetical protein [Archangium violaceum]QRK09565.1 hypothetical protein JQX13_05360 [Archangium violaceum]
MRSLTPSVLLCACTLSGCVLFERLGYHKYQKAEMAPPEEAARIKFPDSYERGVRLEGAMMKALSVAMNDYLPSHIKAENQKGPEYQCLARWDTYRTVVMRAHEDLFFVLLSPDLSKCAPGFIVPDAGAEYAIDGQGRILSRR